MWRHLSNNVVLVPQVLTLCAPRRVVRTSCKWRHVFTHFTNVQTSFLCVICPELLLVPQVLTLCAPRRVVRTSCKWRHVFTHFTNVQTSFLCVICPELLHSYHNCNVDSFFATDEQFQYGMMWILIGSRTHTSDIHVKMAASLSRTFHTSNIVIVAQLS